MTEKYIVYYDEESDAWLVDGPNDTGGSCPCDATRIGWQDDVPLLALADALGYDLEKLCIKLDIPYNY